MTIWYIPVFTASFVISMTMGFAYSVIFVLGLGMGMALMLAVQSEEKS